MEISEKQISYIQNAFSEMKNKQDLLILLNYVKQILYREKAIPFELRHLNYHQNPKANRNRYTQFQVSKKSGGSRTISAPNPGLKAIQRCLNVIFQTIYTPNKAATGFLSGKSIVSNASIHVGNAYVYNADLKDFFSSIDQARIWGRLKFPPFNLNEYSGRLELNNAIVSLCCHEVEVERFDENNNWVKIKKKVLPQGAPTSPTITNIICERLDYLLSAVARRFGLRYTRYADDITFSSMHNVYKKGGEFDKEFRRIVTQQNFFLKESKIRVQNEAYRQEVTGLLVNDKVNVKKRYIKQLRMWIYYWECYGYEKATEIFMRFSNEYDDMKKSNLRGIISGKLHFLKMVKGENDRSYIILKNRFETLSKQLKESSSNKVVIKESKPAGLSRRKESNIVRVRVSRIYTSKKSEIILPIYHRPIELVNLLSKFSTNDSALKYTTHSWDAGRDSKIFGNLREFIGLAKSQYNVFSPHLIKLSKNLNGKIFNFLFNEQISVKGWGANRIKFGWSSPELLEKFNAGNVTPEDIVLPEKYQMQIGSVTIRKFGHVIDVFKNEIEIRDDSDQLQRLIIDKHDKYLLSFDDPVVSNLHNKTFYTDVQWFGRALDLILQNVQKRAQHKNVCYSVTIDTPQFLVLEILHKNSFNDGKSFEDRKFQLKSGDFAEVSKYLKNLCDWSIESRFLEGNYRINFLSSEKEQTLIEKIEKSDGFKHVFKFYK